MQIQMLGVVAMEKTMAMVGGEYRLISIYPPPPILFLQALQDAPGPAAPHQKKTSHGAGSAAAVAAGSAATGAGSLALPAAGSPASPTASLPAALSRLSRGLPAPLFMLPRLLAEARPPDAFPSAHVPHGITSIPKPFQLQVWEVWEAWEVWEVCEGCICERVCRGATNMGGQAGASL